MTVGEDTVSRILARHGLFRRVAVRKPLLSAAAKHKRLQWARNHEDWPLWKWRRVLYSDERIFRTANNRRTILVTRKTTEKFSPQCIAPSLKHGVQVHVWGIIGWRGLGPLKLVRGNLNAHDYQRTIINDLPEFARNLVPPKAKIIFQQDCAPAHTARTTQEFLATHGIEQLPWPGNSPDQNIIENLWATVARKVNEFPTLPRNAQELWERVLQAWESIGIQYAQQLYRSIPKRIQELINSEGGATHY